MTPPYLRIHSSTVSDGSALMETTGSGSSQRRRAARKDGGCQIQRHNKHRRPTLSDTIAHAEIKAGSDEAYFLAQLRAVVAAFETPAGRLLAKYRG
jgi:hypothetical protein